MTVHLGRRDRLLARMRDEGVDALLVTSPINVTYLTGFTGEASWLVLTAAKTILVSDKADSWCSSPRNVLASKP